MEAHDAIVIGAGLAGLRCAVRLAEAGRDVVVLEAQDGVGGRERTDAVDGFLLDRGFHVLNPAYPAVQALGRRRGAATCGRSRSGVRVRRESGPVELTHPLRQPTGTARDPAQRPGRAEGCRRPRALDHARAAAAARGDRRS